MPVDDPGRVDGLEHVAVLHEEIIEALHNLLDRLQVALHSIFVILANRSLDREVDVLQHWEEDLTENFAPEIEVERRNAMIQDLEQDFHGEDLVLRILVVSRKISQIRHDGEP